MLKQITGFRGYWISTGGEVFSSLKLIGRNDGQRGNKSVIVNELTQKKEYVPNSMRPQVGLRINGKQKTMNVSRSARSSFVFGISMSI